MSKTSMQDIRNGAFIPRDGVPVWLDDDFDWSWAQLGEDCVMYYVVIVKHDGLDGGCLCCTDEASDRVGWYMLVDGEGETPTLRNWEWM